MLKIKNKWNYQRLGPYLVSFGIPLLIMLVGFMERGIAPFGDRCFLRTDLYHQYAPFFKELRYKLTTGGSLFYSWNIGGGTNFWTLSAYYLASPLNIFLLLCPESLVIEFVTGNILLKICLSAVTMTYYLNQKYQRAGLDRYESAGFGALYALSGWMAAYNWNIMWLDGVWLFPLVILGLERIVKENKGLLYGLSLGFTLFSNYYIGVMVCFGIAVYCFFLLGTERKMLDDFGWKLLKFIGYTILAIMLSAVFLIPYLYYFGMTASSTGTFKWEWYSYFSVLEVLSRHLINIKTETGLNHWPNIYTGVLVFTTVPLYFLNRKVSMREKIGYAAMLIFFYFSMTTRAMDYIWHVFHIPNSLPGRYTFIYCCFLLVLCYRGFLDIEDRSYRDITISMLIGLVFTFAIEFLLKDNEAITTSVIYLSAVFILLYSIVLFICRRRKLYRPIQIVLLLSVIAIDLCINTSVTSISSTSRSAYTTNDSGISDGMEKVREEEGGDAFYRVEKAVFRTKNDGAWNSFPSISTFSSIGNANLTAFYKNLGMEASTNAYGSYGQTPLTNMLLGVRYTIETTKRPEDGSIADFYTSNGRNVFFYKNRYALSLGYRLDSDLLERWILNSSDPIGTQNDFAFLTAGVMDLFEDVTPHYVPGAIVTLTIPESGYYYVWSPRSGPKEIEVSHGNFSRTFKNLNRGYIIEIGYCEAGEVVNLDNVEASSGKTLDFDLYRLNPDKLRQVYDTLASCQLEVDTFTDTYIAGHIDMTEAGTLFTTVPYEEGWEVYVDGEKAEAFQAKKAYIALDLSEGAHTIEMKFHVVGFPLGLTLTLLAVAGFAAIIVFITLQKKRLEKQMAASQI